MSSHRSQRQLAEDEAYAAALQEEYRRDFLRRQAAKNNHTRRPPSGAVVVPSSNPPRPPPVTSVVPPPPPFRRPSPPPASAPPDVLMWNDNNDDDDDERYARQIQMEMDREERQLQRYGRNSSSSSHNQNSSHDPFPPMVVTTTTTTTTTADDLKLAQELQDEEYARRLQAESRPRSSYNHNHTNVVIRGRPTTLSSSSSSSAAAVVAAPTPDNRHRRATLLSSSSDCWDERRTSSTVSGDEETAWRIQQELQDAEYAHRLSLQEEQAAMAMAAAQQQQQQQLRTPKQNCMRRVLPLLVCGAAVAIIPLLFVLGVFDASDVPFLGDWSNDPWAGNTTTIGPDGPQAGANALAWPNDGNGVTVEILNACSDDWQVLLAQAIANWENGSPVDSLTLRTTRIDYESQCSDVTGKLKVCNGDYGDTQWRGLNEVISNPRRNTIVSSTARLNMYYLDREGDDQKLYTACHELGHGWGLPHWDEDFYNADLGNCMDYTQHPERNSRPDASNFLYLYELYGGRNVTSSTGSSSSAAVQESVVPGARTRRRLSGRRRRRRRLDRQDHQSRLLDVVPYHPRRRVLFADERHEVHAVPCHDDDGDDDGDDEEECLKLQQYLLALPFH